MKKKDVIIDLLECDNFLYDVLRQSTYSTNSTVSNFVVENTQTKKAIEEARKIILFENKNKDALSPSEKDELKIKILNSLGIMK